VGQAIGQVLPLAIGVALSPVPIIVVIALLCSGRATANGLAFLLGWLIGVGAVAGITLSLSDVASVGDESAPTNAASWVKLVLGLLLLVGAGHQWRKRSAHGEEKATPRWMAGITTFTPPRAFAFAALLAGLKPKNLILGAAAGTSIAQADLSGGGQLAALAFFVVLASVGIITPVLYHALGGERVQRTMDGWKLWLQDHNAAVMAVLFLVFGFVLSGQAIQALTT
jgi:Sap, sulfolipid-1-addressing protein